MLCKENLFTSLSHYCVGLLFHAKYTLTERAFQWKGRLTSCSFRFSISAAHNTVGTQPMCTCEWAPVLTKLCGLLTSDLHDSWISRLQQYSIGITVSSTLLLVFVWSSASQKGILPSLLTSLQASRASFCSTSWLCLLMIPARHSTPVL